MVKILLPNHNPKGAIAELVFDSKTNTLTSKSGEKQDKSWLFSNQNDFIHPLLKFKPLSASNNKVTLNYSNYTQLFELIARLYATLLHSDEPDLLTFDFQASQDYLKRSPSDSLYLSINPKRVATEQVSIGQLNKIMQGIYSEPFSFTDNIIINQTIPARLLPETINGDDLFEAEQEIMNYLNQVKDYSHLELRFISAIIGFGVFCRNKITQGDLIGIYAGKKHFTKDITSSFRFVEVDILNLIMDARYHGNITRFINHSPAKACIPDQQTANLIASTYQIKGIDVVAFYAARDIEPGEQLLFQYNETDSLDKYKIYFKQQYQLYDEENKRLKKSPADNFTLSILAKNNVNQAKTYFFIKPAIVLTLVILFLLISTFVNF